MPPISVGFVNLPAFALISFFTVLMAPVGAALWAHQAGWGLLPDIRARQPDASIVILSGADTTAEEARRVEAVLLKSQVSPKDLIDALGSRIRSSRPRRSKA